MPHPRAICHMCGRRLRSCIELTDLDPAANGTPRRHAFICLPCLQVLLKWFFDSPTPDARQARYLYRDRLR